MGVGMGCWDVAWKGVGMGVVRGCWDEASLEWGVGMRVGTWSWDGGWNGVWG